MLKSGIRKVGIFFLAAVILIFGSHYLTTVKYTPPSSTVSSTAK